MIQPRSFVSAAARGLFTLCALSTFGCGALLSSFGEDDEPRAPDTPTAADAAIVDATGTSPGADAASDAGGDGASPTLDASACNARFCSDFDDGDPAPFEWMRVGPSGEAPLTFFGARTDAFVSGPRSFRVQTTPNGGTEQWLEHDLGDLVSASIHITFRIDGVDPGGSVQILALTCASGGDAARVFVHADRSLGLASTATDEVNAPGNVAFGAWAPLRLDLQKNALASAPVKSLLTVGSQQSLPVTSGNCVPPLTLRLGATISAPLTYDVSFDDVAADWKQ